MAKTTNNLVEDLFVKLESKKETDSALLTKLSKVQDEAEGVLNKAKEAHKAAQSKALVAYREVESTVKAMCELRRLLAPRGSVVTDNF